MAARKKAQAPADLGAREHEATWGASEEVKQEFEDTRADKLREAREKADEEGDDV